MADLSTLPLIDGFETTLAQAYAGGLGTMYVNATPSFTFPSGVKTYAVVNPGKSIQQVVEIDSMGVGTLNVSSVTVEKGAGVNYTAQSHAANNKVIISDNYQFRKDIRTAVNTKLDTNGGNGVDYADTAARDAALGADGAATKNYRNIKAGSVYYNYNLSTGQWQSISTGTAPANASTTVAGVVEIATSAQRGAGTATGETGALLVPSNDALVKTSSGASDENKLPVLDATGKLASGFIPDLGLGSNLIDTTYYAGEAITAGQAVFIEPNTTMNYATPLAEASTTPASASGGVTALRGFKMLQNISATISVITKNASCTATRAIIADSSGVTLATATFSGATATFTTPYFIASGTVWRALCDNSGGAYTATYGGATQARTNLNYTLGSNPTSDDVSNGWNIDSITSNTSSLTAQNIGDVVGNTRVAIPVFGTGVNFTTLKLALRKFVSPGVDLGIRIETDNAGSPSGTIVTNGSTTVTSASLTTSLVDTTVTFGGNVNLTVGQRFWIVLFAGTYGSETINATNYFAIGYDNAVHTTTRAIRVRNATVYSAGPTFMTYVSSVGISDNVLSLTDADFSYKVDARGISEDTVSVGGNPRITYDGINDNQSGLVYNQVYYVSNTTGGISTTAGTNSRYIGKGVSSNKLLIKPYHQF